MSKIEINIDKHQIRKKPPKGDYKFAAISRRLSNNKEELTMQEIIHEVGEHFKAFTRAVMKNETRNNASFEKQIFLVLDFDEHPDYENSKKNVTNMDLIIHLHIVR